jgi:hypothetical protein
MPSRRSPRQPAASRVKKPTPTPDARTAPTGRDPGSPSATAGQGNHAGDGNLGRQGHEDKAGKNDADAKELGVGHGQAKHSPQPKHPQHQPEHPRQHPQGDAALADEGDDNAEEDEDAEEKEKETEEEEEEEEQEDEDDADHPCACPYCGKLGQQCDDHLLINIDVTFGEVWGPASGLFREFVHRDEDGETLSRTLAFLSACEVVAVCVDQYSEGGPGMSSHDYWCWSEDPATALKELKAELAKRE